ncbi:type I-B CRISPR-associated protein Cas5 [candidate division KSB1 bacterium]|nr:type I-B CRISPR-associated protein Cas5 [candidate division KSB1 bacterium]
MQILVFDIIGKFGHFRKYYSNSSALSYGIPPRTTICGMIGAILGWPKDSYYSKMITDECKIGVACKNPIRKTIHKLNYLYVKGTNDLNASYGNPTQVPFEVVSAPFLGKDNIRYRIFISHNNELINNELKERLRKSQCEFSLSLGSANFIASIQFIAEISPEVYYDGEQALISSVVPLEQINDFMFDLNQEKSYLIELVPFQFNEKRELTCQKEVLYCDSGEGFQLKLHQPYFKLRYQNDESENIVFMEY